MIEHIYWAKTSFTAEKTPQRTRLEAFLRLHQHDGVGTDVRTSGHTLVLQI